MRRDGTLLFTPRQVFLPLATSCAGGIGLIAVLARDRELAVGAAVSFAIATVISLVMATVLGAGDRRHHAIARIVAVGALGATAALPGWFFGPSSAYAGVLAIILLFAGLIMGGDDTPFPTLGAWFVYVAIAGGQATVATLVFTGTIRDASLLPMIPAGASPWHHIAAHVTVQLVYATAFGIGRALHHRYWALSEELDVATRAAARRAALLDEARAEYRRTFALGRDGIFAGHTVGRYELGELIGRGGAGEVYSARDVIDGSQVAIKLLRGDRLDDPTEVRSFLDEATALSQLDHPHVVRTHQVGGLDELVPFIAMERLEGTTLAQLIARSGRLDRTTVRALIDGAGQALAAVHRAALTHGDLNPNNLVLADGTWKLIDFGANRSEAGGVVGTPRFIAPERLAGAPRGPAADLYGLCACIYAAVTGREPFAEVAPAALPEVVSRQLPLDPRIHGEITEDVACALAIGLAVSPTDRYPDATALRACLLGAHDGVIDDALRTRAAALPPWTDAFPMRDAEPTATEPGVPVPAARTAPAALDDASDALLSGTITSLDAASSTAWRGAFADKMRLQYAAVFAACLIGALLVAAIVDDRAMRAVGLGTIAIAAGVVAFARIRQLEWPWLIVATLAVGPAYVLGVHSGFAAVIAVTLFIESSFRSSPSGVTGRGWVLGAVVVSHAAVYALIVARVIPDGGVTPVLHHTPAWSGIVIQIFVTSIYVGGFVIGRTIHARYRELVARNDAAARDAANKQALLATARAEIDRVLAGYTGGLFTGSRIGAYAIGPLLGRGGMGEVYAATRDGQQVALKVIRSDRVGGDSLKRFAREAEALMRVESPYVARVLEVGTEDGRLPFLAMELVAGVSLAELLRERDRLELAEVRALTRDVARGLADVHRAGVVHRDVKPHNLLHTVIDGTGRWKLVDFGIAKVSGAAQATTGHVIVGTPAYMAPEQLAGRAIDARSDLYSLGLVLYRVLAGRPAFTATRITAIHQPPPSPYRIPDLPDDLRHVLRIVLATSPSDRFATASELEAALDAAFEGQLGDPVRDRARALELREPWS